MELSTDWVFHFLHDKLCQRELPFFQRKSSHYFHDLGAQCTPCKICSSLCKQQSEVSSMMQRKAHISKCNCCLLQQLNHFCGFLLAFASCSYVIVWLPDRGPNWVASYGIWAGICDSYIFEIFSFFAFCPLFEWCSICYIVTTSQLWIVAIIGRVNESATLCLPCFYRTKSFM